MFSLATNKLSVGRYFKTMKIPSALAKFPPRFSIHRWSLPDLNWIAIATTCWQLQCQHSLHTVIHYSALYIIYLFIFLWSIWMRDVLLVRWFIIHHWLNYSGAQTVSDLVNGSPFIFVTRPIIFFLLLYPYLLTLQKKKVLGSSCTYPISSLDAVISPKSPDAIRDQDLT